VCVCVSMHLYYLYRTTRKKNMPTDAANMYQYTCKHTYTCTRMCIHNIHMRACVCPYTQGMHANNTYHTHLNRTTNFSLVHAHTQTHINWVQHKRWLRPMRGRLLLLSVGGLAGYAAVQVRISPKISALMNSPLKTTSKLNFESFQAKMRPVHLVWDLVQTSIRLCWCR